MPWYINALADIALKSQLISERSISLLKEAMREIIETIDANSGYFFMTDEALLAILHQFKVQCEIKDEISFDKNVNKISRAIYLFITSVIIGVKNAYDGKINTVTFLKNTYLCDEYGKNIYLLEVPGKFTLTYNQIAELERTHFKAHNKWCDKELHKLIEIGNEDLDIALPSNVDYYLAILKNHLSENDQIEFAKRFFDFKIKRFAFNSDYAVKELLNLNPKVAAHVKSMIVQKLPQLKDASLETLASYLSDIDYMKTADISCDANNVWDVIASEIQQIAFRTAKDATTGYANVISEQALSSFIKIMNENTSYSKSAEDIDYITLTMKNIITNRIIKLSSTLIQLKAVLKRFATIHYMHTDAAWQKFVSGVKDKANKIIISEEYCSDEDAAFWYEIQMSYPEIKNKDYLDVAEKIAVLESDKFKREYLSLPAKLIATRFKDKLPLLKESKTGLELIDNVRSRLLTLLSKMSSDQIIRDDCLYGEMFVDSIYGDLFPIIKYAVHQFENLAPKDDYSQIRLKVQIKDKILDLVKKIKIIENLVDFVTKLELDAFSFLRTNKKGENEDKIWKEIIEGIQFYVLNIAQKQKNIKNITSKLGHYNKLLSIKSDVSQELRDEFEEDYLSNQVKNMF